MKQLIEQINEAAYEVRKNLTPGYLESVYRNALLFELRQRGLQAEDEAPIKVNYKGTAVGEFRCDILVNNAVIIELKACRELKSSHEAQLVNYLNATKLDYGILINYGGEKFAFRVKTRIYDPR